LSSKVFHQKKFFIKLSIFCRQQFSAQKVNHNIVHRARRKSLSTNPSWPPQRRRPRSTSGRIWRPRKWRPGPGSRRCAHGRGRETARLGIRGGAVAGRRHRRLEAPDPGRRGATAGGVRAVAGIAARGADHGRDRRVGSVTPEDETGLETFLSCHPKCPFVYGVFTQCDRYYLKLCRTTLSDVQKIGLILSVKNVSHDTICQIVLMYLLLLILCKTHKLQSPSPQVEMMLLCRTRRKYIIRFPNIIFDKVEMAKCKFSNIGFRAIKLINFFLSDTHCLLFFPNCSNKFRTKS
jgi:hypothetical protein